METRTKLIIVLCGIVALVVIVMGILIATLVGSSDTIKPENRVEAEQTKIVERKSPWANQGDAAITFLTSLMSSPPVFPKTDEQIQKEKEEARNRKGKKRSKEEDDKDSDENERPHSYGELLGNEKFRKDILKLSGKDIGWTSEWWGETKYGQSFFLVRYTVDDGIVKYGPEWLVELKNTKAKPINLLAQVVENPKEGIKSKYYNQEANIISAIASHRFENKMSLAGALLIYFEQQEGSDEENDIQGWTVVHQRGSLFRAYFQWTTKKVQQYAEFEFDFDDKKLKPVNFQAAEIMKVGEDFDRKRVDIMPQSYDPAISNPSKRWIGPARKACASAEYREQCDAFATMLEQKEIIESVEWLLTAREDKPGEFKQCQETRNCVWKPTMNGPNDFTVTYEYKLNPKAKEPSKISWRVRPKEKDVIPLDAISKLAMKAVRPK